MRLAIVYNPKDYKLQPESYSQAYREMLLAVKVEFSEGLVEITQGCSAADIEADAILFYDVHSSHHIIIDGLAAHPAYKIEFMNDPHQKEVQGFYPASNANLDGGILSLQIRDRFVHKLNAKQRIARARARGINKIWCPYREGFRRYLAPHLGHDAKDMLWHFPVVRSGRHENTTPLPERKREVLANGCTWCKAEHFYDFRNWAHSRSGVTCIQHNIKDPSTPKAEAYMGFVAQYAGALALCDAYPIPKYFELPLAGCVTFVQQHAEYMDLGFEDGANCIVVDRHNFDGLIQEFLTTQGDPAWREIALQGRYLVANKYTAEHCARALRRMIEKEVTAAA